MAIKSVADHEPFVSLIQTAREDASIRTKLLAILDQPPYHRKSLLRSFVADMKLQSAPADFVRAVAFLLDDDIAEKARDLLKES